MNRPRADVGPAAPSRTGVDEFMCAAVRVNLGEVAADGAADLAFTFTGEVEAFIDAEAVQLGTTLFVSLTGAKNVGTKQPLKTRNDRDTQQCQHQQIECVCSSVSFLYFVETRSA